MAASVLSESLLHEGFVNVSRLTARTPDGEVSREIEHHGEAAVVLAFDPERRVAALVEVFRFGPLKGGGVPTLIEACAGMIDDGETAETAARREAMEEMGLTLTRLEPIGAFWSTPGVSSEKLHLFLAPFSPEDRTGSGGGDPEEQEGLRPIERRLGDLWRELERGGVTDLKTALLLQALRLRRPQLFE